MSKLRWTMLRWIESWQRWQSNHKGGTITPSSATTTVEKRGSQAWTQGGAQWLVSFWVPPLHHLSPLPFSPLIGTHLLTCVWPPSLLNAPCLQLAPPCDPHPGGDTGAIHAQAEEPPFQRERRAPVPSASPNGTGCLLGAVSGGLPLQSIADQLARPRSVIG